MELVPIRCKGNDCKKYDDKVWWEDIKTIVQLNNQAVDNLHKCDIKNGDQVLVKFASSKAKKPKLYSVNNLLLNAMYTLSHNYLQEGCINSKFSPGGSSFLVESVTQVSIFYSVLFLCYERISAFRKKSIIEHAYLLSNSVYRLSNR